MALQQSDKLEERNQGRPKSVGADKNYHSKKFAQGCRERGISPHVAQVKGRKVPGLDGRTTQKGGYRMSQTIRKRIEEIFGWMKVVGGLQKSRYRGRERTQAWGSFVGAAYNLVRMARLAAAT